MTISAVRQSRIFPTRKRPDIRILPRPEDAPPATKAEDQPESPLHAPQPRKLLPPKDTWLRSLHLQIPGSPCIGECDSKICRQGSPKAMTLETSLYSTRRNSRMSTKTVEQNEVEPSEAMTLLTCDQEHQSTIVTNTKPGSDGTGNDGAPNDPECICRLTGFKEETGRPFSTTPRAMSPSELFATTSMCRTETSDRE